MSEEVVQTRAPDEYERVLSHREQMFRDVLGFSFEASIILAESNADWHEAARLLDSGCPKHIALNLLT